MAASTIDTTSHRSRACGSRQQRLVNAVDKGYQRCKDHDLSQITRLMSFERTALILGLDPNNGFPKALDCAHFQISFDADLTSSGTYQLGAGSGTGSFSGEWERQFTKVPASIEVWRTPR